MLSSVRSIPLSSQGGLDATISEHSTHHHARGGSVAPFSPPHPEPVSAQAVVDQEEPLISIETLPSPGSTESYTVLIHGLNGQGTDLEALGRAIQAAHPETQVLIVDYRLLARPGVAHTNVPNVERNLPDVAREVVAELRSFGISPQKTVVFGYSYGADVARYMTELGYNATTVGIETAVRVSKFDRLPDLDVNIGANSMVWDRNAAAKSNDYTLTVLKHPRIHTHAAHDMIIDKLIDEILGGDDPVDWRIESIYQQLSAVGKIIPASPETPTTPTPSPTTPTPSSPPATPPPSQTPVQQAQALVTAISTAAANPSKPAPPSPNNSAEVLFLLNLADNGFYGPPKPPPAFAIANLIAGANNGSVPVNVIAQVLYDIAVMFGPLSGLGTDSVGSFYVDVASQANDQAEGPLISDLSEWAIANVTGSLLLGQQAQQFLLGIDGPTLGAIATGSVCRGFRARRFGLGYHRRPLRMTRARGELKCRRVGDTCRDGSLSPRSAESSRTSPGPAVEPAGSGRRLGAASGPGPDRRGRADRWQAVARRMAYVRRQGDNQACSERRSDCGLSCFPRSRLGRESHEEDKCGLTTQEIIGERHGINSRGERSSSPTPSRTACTWERHSSVYTVPWKTMCVPYWPRILIFQRIEDELC